MKPYTTKDEYEAAIRQQVELKQAIRHQEQLMEK